MTALAERIRAEVDAAQGEIVAFAAELVRVPTVNPPGEAYADCARLIGERLDRFGFEVAYLAAEGRPEHTSRYPRLNVLGRRGGHPGPAIHLNGHFDVVPPGEGWSVAPFAGLVRDGRLYGRGACDMKGGIAAMLYAAEALRRAGFEPGRPIEVSGTVDEESGGYAGVAWLAENGHLSRERTEAVIIPEPFGPDRICLGHRGVYWFDVTTRGNTAHGSMPFLGQSAIDSMGALLEAVRSELLPALATRTTAMPVVPAGAARATLNVNAVAGGQPIDGPQSPCVADTCRAIFDRRFLIEESPESVRAEIEGLLERVATRVPGLRYELADRMLVHPVMASADSALVKALSSAVRDVLGREPALVASPGTYDQKHVARIAGVDACVAYGPGRLELAHQPDESLSLDDLLLSTKVLALALARLTGGLGE